MIVQLAMARRLRLQFKDAMYHVINRGNYRRDVFDSVGAAQAFETTLLETCERYGWKLYAHVVMRNHYHLAVGTPHANLVEGMHWLQGTFATRFNRFRTERGHLFQGRYHALLIEDAAALARVVNYIHLNPVRAKIMRPEHAGAFRWSSLRRFLSDAPPPWVARDWLVQLGFEESVAGRRAYLKYLVALAEDAAEQERQGFGKMKLGWAIGTDGWRKAMARKYSRRAFSPGLSGEELREMKHERWSEVLARALRDAGKTEQDVRTDIRSAAWKIRLARRLRHHGAPCGWVAERLNMGKAASVSAYLWRANREVTP